MPYMLVHVGILNPRVEDMSYISAWEFSDCFAGGVGYALFSFHIYTFAYHEWGITPGSVKL